MRRSVLGVALLAIVAVVLLGVAQLLLPGIAAQRLRDRLAAHGQVRSVRVDAFPAVELLWHHADRVRIVLGSYSSAAGPQAPAQSLLAEAGDVGSLDVSAAQVDLGLLRLRDAQLSKHGAGLSARGFLSQADLRAAIPFLQALTPLASARGALVLRGSADVLGLGVSVDFVVAVRQGAIVADPLVPLGGLATVTVFSDPHLQVQSISARAAPGGFTVSAQARLR